MQGTSQDALLSNFAPLSNFKENKMNLKRIFLTALALSLIVASILPATAQTSKGILAGIVRDKTGAVIPGAKVTLTSQDTSEARGAVADERGAYRIDAVNSGHYMVSVQAGGFETAKVRISRRVERGQA